MERELKHSPDRAVGPHYKRDTRLHDSLWNTFRDGFSAPYSSHSTPGRPQYPMGIGLPASLFKKPDLLHGINPILPKASDTDLGIQSLLVPGWHCRAGHESCSHRGPVPCEIPSCCCSSRRICQTRISFGKTLFFKA